jgi:hypothetical protein
MSKHDIPVEELSELLDVLGQKVPALVSQLKDTLFSAEAGRELGKACGAFYQELVDSGIPAEEALQMTKSYIASLQGVLDKANLHGRHSGHSQ